MPNVAVKCLSLNYGPSAPYDPLMNFVSLVQRQVGGIQMKTIPNSASAHMSNLFLSKVTIWARTFSIAKLVDLN